MILFLLLAAGIKHSMASGMPQKAAPTQPVVMAARPTVGEVESDKPKSKAPTDPGTILCSLDAPLMSPDEIVHLLSVQTHANVILLTKPDMKITIRLSNVPLSQMIQHICAMCDLSFLIIDKTYVIASPEKLKSAYPVQWTALHPAVKIDPPVQIENVTETYNTSFVSSGDLAKSLNDLFKGQSVVFVAGPNPMSPTIGNQDGSKTTGTSTAILAKEDAASSISRMLIVSGEKSLVASGLVMAKQLDRPRRQVSIAVTIHDISNDALNDLGVTWDFGTTGLSESQGKGVNFGQITRSPISISATLAALDKTTKSKLLASPNISVLDGEHAFVLIGDRIAYPVLVGYSQNNAPIFSKEEERVGIYLQVAASISQDGKVTLSLYPQVSTITGYLTVNGASYPQVSTREAQTTLRVASGDTIVMGGLYNDEDIATIEKVPFLSQIPLLGAIFQHRKITKSKSQVIITVTPTVIEEKSK